MSERNHSLGPNNDEALSWSTESEEEKSKKDKQKEDEKRKRRNKKRDDSSKEGRVSTERRRPDEDDGRGRRRPAFLANYLGVEKVSDAQADKKQAKKKGEAEPSAKHSSESDATSSPEDARRPREKLDDAEAIEATEAYILARRRQLEAASTREDTAEVAGIEAEDETHEDQDEPANRASLRFLEALRRNLQLRRSPPDETMLETALHESQDEEDTLGAPSVNTAHDEGQEQDQEQEASGHTAEASVHPPDNPESIESPSRDGSSSGELADDTVVHLSDRSAPEPTEEAPGMTNDGPNFQPSYPTAAQASFGRSAGVRTSAERSPRRSSAGDFLLGGFVGYLLGKRRGRIKTEKQLEPVRASLEQEVGRLEQTIRRYEDRARASSEARQQAPQAEARDVVSGEPDVETTDPAARLSQQVLEQSEPLAHVQKKTAEHLTGMGVAQEAISYQTGTAESREERGDPSLTPQRVDTMPTSSLLRHVESIRYNQTDVRSLFERGELSDRALRGALKEHLRGNSIDNYLDKELRKQRETPEVYSPEKMWSSQQHKSDDMLPAPSSREETTPGQSVTSSQKGEPVAASSTEVDTARSPEQLHAERMKQASIGAVLGVIIVIVLWVLFGSSSLL